MIRFSGSKPGSLAISCVHLGKIHHILVGVENLDSPKLGCFVIGDKRCKSLRETFKQNNLHYLTHVLPCIPLEDSRFSAAFDEADKVLEAPQIEYTEQGSIYDSDLDGTTSALNNTKLYDQLRLEMEKGASYKLASGIVKD